MNELCWAASISMLFQYYNHPISQGDIVRIAFGELANMPVQPAQLTSALNRTWKDSTGGSFIVTTTKVFDNQNGFFNINGDDVIDALSNSQPVVIGTSQHTMLLTAVKYRRMPSGLRPIYWAGVIDPWYGKTRYLGSTDVIVYAAIVSIKDAVAETGHSLDGAGNSVPDTDSADLQTAASPSSNSSSFADGLRKITEAAKSQFPSIKGSPLGGDAESERFASLVSLPNTDHGSVTTYKDGSSAMVWYRITTMNTYQEDAARATYDSLKQDIISALGAGWQSSETGPQVKIIFKTFVMKNSDGVEIHLVWIQHSSGHNEAELSIHAP